MSLRLRRLRLSDKAAYLAYLSEWDDLSKVIPHSSQMQGLSYEDYLFQLKQRERGLNLPFDRVPGITYILVDDQHVIYGVLNLRLRLNDHLLKYDGHIGYGIAPSKRQKGYGKQILKLGLNICKKRGMDKILITCNEENLASEGIIKSQGGILENRVYKTDGYIKRYWIQITK
ncbi:MAG: GNAT family N-acetyltransferase [Acholeplasmataceae bacterium]|nr:GNAT family N-acetyltransferase [Acholeplasmataceae bacterium]